METLLTAIYMLQGKKKYISNFAKVCTNFKIYKIFYKILATQNQSSDQEQQLYKLTELKKK